MSLIASSASNNFVPLESGSYPSRILQIVDLGTQEQRAYKGVEKPPAQRVLIVYELQDEFLPNDDGTDNVTKPRVISENFPLHYLTSERATSTKRYFVLDPDNKHNGDFSKLIDVPVVVSIIQNPGNDGRIWNNVAGIIPMRSKDAEKATPLVNPPVVFTLDAPTMEDWNRLYPWVQEMIKGNLHYSGSALQAMVETITKETGDNPY